MYLLDPCAPALSHSLSLLPTSALSCQNIHLLQRQQEVQSISHLFTHTHTRAHAYSPHTLSRSPALLPIANMLCVWCLPRCCCCCGTVVQCSERTHCVPCAGHVMRDRATPLYRTAKGDEAATATLSAVDADAAAVLSVAHRKIVFQHTHTLAVSNLC